MVATMARDVDGWRAAIYASCGRSRRPILGDGHVPKREIIDGLVDHRIHHVDSLLERGASTLRLLVPLSRAANVSAHHTDALATLQHKVFSRVAHDGRRALARMRRF